MTWFHDAFFLLSFVSFGTSVRTTYIFARRHNVRWLVASAFLTILNLTLAAYWAARLLGWSP